MLRPPPLLPLLLSLRALRRCVTLLVRMQNVTLILLIIAWTSIAYAHEGHDHGPATEDLGSIYGPIELTPQAMANLQIESATAKIEPLQETLEMSASIRELPERQAKITTRFDGQVIDLFVQLGEPVKKGQTILTVQPLTVGSSKFELKSPIDGYVLRQNVTPGQSFTPTTVLMEIANYSQVLARAMAYESPALTEIRPGLPARLRLDSFPNEVFHGNVQRVDVGLQPDSRMFDIYILLDNPELKIKPNMQGVVFLGLGKAHKGLAVPKSAILGDLGQLFAFVQNGNTFERRNVVTGIQAGDHIEILEGILPGENVVIRGNYQLQYIPSKPKK